MHNGGKESRISNLYGHNIEMKYSLARFGHVFLTFLLFPELKPILSDFLRRAGM